MGVLHHFFVVYFIFAMSGGHQLVLTCV